MQPQGVERQLQGEEENEGGETQENEVRVRVIWRRIEEMEGFDESENEEEEEEVVPKRQRLPPEEKEEIQEERPRRRSY